MLPVLYRSPLHVCQIRHTLSCRELQGQTLVWLRGRVSSPPLSQAARVETGYLLRCLQRGELLSMPHSRPMPVIDRCRRRLRDYDHEAE